LNVTFSSSCYHWGSGFCTGKDDMVTFGRSEGAPIADPLIRPFHEDMEECEELLSTATGAKVQFARRMYIRSFFAYLEVRLLSLSKYAQDWLLADWRRTGEVELGKILLLREETFRPSDTGKLSNEAARIPFKSWCAFVVRTAAESWQVDCSKLFSDNGWNAMKKSVDVRHRLTHPKTPQDAEVSEGEIWDVRCAHTWFFNCESAIINAGLDAARKLDGG
jgi:hypothetical protein